MPLRTGSVALVTGAASGIGSAVCTVLTANGQRVAGLDLPGHEADAEVELALGADVSSELDVEKAVRRIEAELGPVEVLVTAAGFLATSPVADIDDEAWRRMLAVHLDGTFHCCRAVAPAMVERGRGTIVTISSELALTGAEFHAHYCAAKGAIIAFTKSIALELSPYGVRANCVAPGPTDTPLLTDEWRTPEYLATLPIRRIALPEEVAEAVRFLASPEADCYVGEVLSPSCGAVM